MPLSVRTCRLRQLALAASIALASGVASAHDTWLQVAPQQAGGGLLTLQLGTGGRYPKSEGVIPGSRVADAGCMDDAGERHGLAPRNELPLALELRSRLGAARAAGCWLELLPVDLTLPTDLVDTYFHDVRAPQAVRDAWARQLKAGAGWKEVYRKYVRIEAPLGGATPRDLSRVRTPRGYALELLPVGPDALRANAPATFQALANGKPVSGLAVEFVHVAGVATVWKETDAQGRMELALPATGEWLLRGTFFELPDANGVWHTRFGTLTVQVQ